MQPGGQNNENIFFASLVTRRGYGHNEKRALFLVLRRKSILYTQKTDLLILDKFFYLYNFYRHLSGHEVDWQIT